MEYFNWMLTVLFLTFLTSRSVTSWNNEWTPNYVSTTPESLTSPEVFDGLTDQDDFFKLLLVEDDKAFIGSRNRVYYMSLTDTKNISTLLWEPDDVSMSGCQGQIREECVNYIRVLVRKTGRQLFICGTNSYQPKCRHYNLSKNGEFAMSRKGEEGGTGICPFDQYHNSTALYTDGTLYTATVTDYDSRYPLILKQDKQNHFIRTRPRDSMMLNQPNFVSSFDKGDKVIHFFRETAVEHINCGKVVYSRVARVCKEDRGGIKATANVFTSFFKARLNCSIPGTYPFYFDEIQGTSEFGQGNYRPTLDSGDRSDMIYGIFNTPENSIKGSAVCAYRYSDIDNVFRGRFKGQEGIYHNWLPVTWGPTPEPHPGKCVNDSKELSQETISFNLRYPLMDEAVQPQGGAPLLLHTSFNSRFTQIAIDWQVKAADGHYYDVMFVGTDDGRVIKSINKGQGKEIESVIIEDLQVVNKGDPIVNLKVLSDRSDSRLQKLVVVSRQKVVSIPLHRCSRAQTCSKCVGLQDPYCVWNADMEQCINAESGLQSIKTGKHDSCKPDEVPIQASSTPVIEEKCSCTSGANQDSVSTNKGQKGEGPTEKEEIVIDAETEVDIEIGKEAPVLGASTVNHTGDTKVEILIVAVIISVLVSLLIGFLIGYKVQSCRNRDRDSVFYDSKCSTLQRGRNRLSSGDNPYFHTDHTSLTPKQMNYVVNVKNTKTNSGAEIKPVTKSNKVYL